MPMFVLFFLYVCVVLSLCASLLSVVFPFTHFHLIVHVRMLRSFNRSWKSETEVEVIIIIHLLKLNVKLTLQPTKQLFSFTRNLY